MSKSSKYWDKRAIKRLSDAERTSDIYVNRIKNIYNQAYRNIDKEISSVYRNYSKETGLDVEKLKTLLTKKETDKVWKTLERQGLTKYIKSNYKSRISRLEQVQAQLYAKAKQIYPKEELAQTMCYKGVINDSYYKAVYDTQMGTGLDFSFNNIDDNVINVMLNEKWSGKNYSQRIWGNTDILANSLSQVIGGALLSGQSIEKTSKQIRDRFNVGKYYSERLVRTETNHFNNEADAMAYEEMGVDKYVFVATLDSRTSVMCQEMDNQVFDYKDREVGYNFPPLHPNCRSKTRGYLGEEAEKLLQRRARNPITGKNEVIDNMSYKEWAKNVMGIDSNNYVRPYNQKAKLVDVKYNKIKGKHTISDDVKNTNPNYNINNPKYYRNCQRCVPAYEMRRRGYNVIAKPRILEYNKDIDLPKKPYLVWDNPQIIQPKRELEMTIKNKMLEWGDNARAQICVYWKNGGGHTFVAEQIGGKTVFVDPQVNDLDVRKYFKNCKVKGSYFYRIDNLKTTEYINDCCEEVLR